LFAYSRLRIPAVIKKHKQGLDPMSRRNFQILADPSLKVGCIALPNQIMQKCPHKLNPMPAAHPSSRSMVSKSKVVACHISI
jgi:hypothetical protein